MQRLSPRPFRKRPASETETEGRIFFLEVSNQTKWLLEPCGAYVKSISRVNSYQKVIYPGTKEDLMVDWDQGYVNGIAMWDIKGKEIEIIHRLFLVIAMYCQASSSQLNKSLNLPRC